MANQFSKSKIDFDVYERANPQSQINWAQEAKDITKRFEDIRDDRITRKKELDDVYRNQQEALNDIDQYSSKNIRQFVMSGANNAGQASANYYDLMKRGLVKPSEFNMFQQNLSDDFTMVKNNASNLDLAFKDFAERTKGLNGKPLNSKQERLRASLVEGFANLNNAVLDVNGDTGNLGFVRTATEQDVIDGKAKKKGDALPGETKSLTQMNVLMFQKTDNIDLTALIDGSLSKVGEVVEAFAKKKYGSNYQVTKETYPGLLKEFKGEGGAALEALIDEIAPEGSEAVATILGSYGRYNGNAFDPAFSTEYEKAQDNLKTTESFEVPSLEDKAQGTAFRKWIRETHPDYATDNNIDATGSNSFVKDAYSQFGEEYAKDELGVEPTTTTGVNYLYEQVWDENIQGYKSVLTDEQYKIVRDLVKTRLYSKLDMKQEVAIGGLTQPRPTPNPPKITARDKDNFNGGNLLRKGIQGDREESLMALKNLKERWNQQAGAKTPEITSLDRVGITATADDVSNGYASKVGEKFYAFKVKKKGEAAKIVKSPTGEGMFDSLWADLISIKDGSLIEYPGKVSDNIFQGTAYQDIPYDEKIMNLNKVIVRDSQGEGGTKSYYEYMDDVAETDYRGDLIEGGRKAIKKLIDSPKFIPEALRDRVKDDGGEIKVTYMDENNPKGNIAVRIGDHVGYINTEQMLGDTDGDEEFYQVVGEAVKDIVRESLGNQGGGSTNKKVSNNLNASDRSQ